MSSSNFHVGHNQSGLALCELAVTTRELKAPRPRDDLVLENCGFKGLAALF
jgi:hypothetical protein